MWFIFDRILPYRYIAEGTGIWLNSSQEAVSLRDKAREETSCVSKKISYKTLLAVISRPKRAARHGIGSLVARTADGDVQIWFYRPHLSRLDLIKYWGSRGNMNRHAR